MLLFANNFLAVLLCEINVNKKGISKGLTKLTLEPGSMIRSPDGPLRGPMVEIE